MTFGLICFLSGLLLCSLQILAECPISHGTCNYKDFFITFNQNKPSRRAEGAIYFLYDVNSVEGFNLRRDVYIRLAVFLKALRKKAGFEKAQLVLPPFPRLYHWKSDHIVQDSVLWRQFFDIPSMRNYTAVLDFDEFLREIGVGQKERFSLDHVYQLQNFEDMFVNGVFTDKFEEKPCVKENHYRRPFLNNQLISHKVFSCLKFQGSASLLEKFLKKKLKR